MSQDQGSIFDLARRLVLNGKDDNYVAMVEQNAELVQKLVNMVKRIQKVAPDVALSPYIMRAVRLLRERNLINDSGIVPAAA